MHTLSPLQAFGRSSFSPLVNLRSLGGLPVAGGRVRENMIWRSDDICLTTHEEVRALVSLGLSDVIDLRSTEELAQTGRGHCENQQVRHHHLPFTEGTNDPGGLSESLRAIASPDDVGRWYAGLFRAQADKIVAALRVIAAAEGGALFHCAAGKDRTGILAAAILGCLGATKETIIADYAATHANIEAILERLDRHRHSAGGSAFAQYAGHPMLGADAANMGSMLTALENDGGMTAVLRPAGCDAELEAAMKERLVISED